MICSTDFPAILQPYLSSCKDILDESLGVKYTQSVTGVLSHCPVLHWQDTAIVQAGAKAAKSTIGARVIPLLKAPNDNAKLGDEYYIDYIWPELLSDDYDKFIEQIPKNILKTALTFDEYNIELVLKRIKDSALICGLTPKFFYRCYDKKQHMLDITVRGITADGWCYCINTALLIKPEETV